MNNQYQTAGAQIDADKKLDAPQAIDSRKLSPAPNGVESRHYMRIIETIKTNRLVDFFALETDVNGKIVVMRFFDNKEDAESYRQILITELREAGCGDQSKQYWLRPWMGDMQACGGG